MVKSSRSLRVAWAVLAFGLGSRAYATNYYVDSVRGSASNPGTSAGTAWKTLAQVNRRTFQAGDHILFAAGSAWHEQLAPKSSGTEGDPIVLDRFGDGAMPSILGDGVQQDAVLLRNVQNIELRHLAISNRGEGLSPRRGVHIVLDNYGTAHNIVIADLYIHDVNGTNAEKDNGGIVFRTNGDKIPSRFDGLTIKRNIVWRVDRSGIVAESYHAMRSRWFPSLHVTIRDNYVEDIGGDGIVPWATDGALVEHNIARRCNQRSTDFNAGIWQWSTDNTLLRLNEASETKGTHDGEGFDSDYNSRNTRFEYNYSHDNDGGFMLICTPVKRDEQNNLGNTGTVVRFNISRNDRTRLVNLSGADQVTVDHNAFYVGDDREVQMLVSDWQGWSDGARFEDNVFYVPRGVLHFGHAVARASDGTYTIAPGWGPAKDIIYRGNRYAGHVLDGPSDYPSSSSDMTTIEELKIDWHEPTFDPSQPSNYPTFISAHRAWMVNLMEEQFGRRPQ